MHSSLSAMSSNASGLGYPPPPPGSGPSNANGPRTGPNMSAGLRQGGPSSQPRITPEFLQQAISGAMRANNIPSANGTGQQGQANGLLSQLLGSYQAPGPTPPSTEDTEQPMQGVQESIEQQMESRREQLEQLHSMGLMDDLQNIQVHI